MRNNDVLLGLIAIITGIVVLAWNDALQWAVGIFLVVWGAFHLLGKRH